jgi:hypothetical protein
MSGALTARWSLALWVSRLGTGHADADGEECDKDPADGGRPPSTAK